MNAILSSHKRRARGFTLVELMIAVTIGLFLTAVIAQLFLGSRATYTTTDELSRMQENIRFTHQLFTRVLYLTSYMSSPNSFRERERAPDATTPVTFEGGTAGLVGTQGAGTASDTFTIRFQGSGLAGAPDGTITDCLGRPIDSPTIAVNIFSIGVNGGLMCDNGQGAGPVEVVPDVENMQVLFGEDTEPWKERDGTVNRFVPYSTVSNPDRIVALRVALLFRTPGLQANVASDTRTYDLNGVVLGPFNDTRLRRAVTMTFALRNRTN
jgi:type IV pilus assembly protein PilW